jgi:hypothetical protein
MGAGRGRIVVVVICLAMMGTVACSTWVQPRYGEVAPPGLTITAEDGSFTLTAGERFTPTFVVESDLTALCAWNPERPDLERVGDYLDAGARRVRVRHPAYDGELYGVLALCEVPDDTGVASRSYSIEVADSYATETEGGRRTVVFGVVPCADYSECHPWLLWLSREPFEE